MKQRFLLLIVLTAALGSCTTMYKSGQTPDDVYYSPTKEAPAYVETENSRDMQEDSYSSDRYLRMKSSNRSRWSAFDDDFAYWNNPSWNNQRYYNSFYSGVYNPWVGSGWNYGFGYGNIFAFGGNPYYPGYYGTPVIIINPKTVNTRAYAPRGGNLNTYNNSRNVYTDPKTGERTYNISSGSSTLRTYRSSGGSYYNPSSGSSRYNSNGSPSRTIRTTESSSPTYRSNNNGSSGSSNSGGTRSGSSSGGSAPVRTFPRGGGR